MKITRRHLRQMILKEMRHAQKPKGTEIDTGRGKVSLYSREESGEYKEPTFDYESAQQKTHSIVDKMFDDQIRSSSWRPGDDFKGYADTNLPLDWPTEDGKVLSFKQHIEAALELYDNWFRASQYPYHHIKGMMLDITSQQYGNLLLSYIHREQEKELRKMK